MSRLIALPPLFAALLLASCSSGDPASPAAPTTFASASSMSISAQPVLASLQTTVFPGCPVVTPFVMPFIVTVTPTGTVGIVVTNITTRFTDFAGVQAPAVTLPAPIPTIPFGTALEQARNAQNFAFNICRTIHPGTVVVTVNTRDTSGRNASGTVTVGVK